MSSNEEAPSAAQVEKQVLTSVSKNVRRKQARSASLTSIITPTADELKQLQFSKLAILSPTITSLALITTPTLGVGATGSANIVATAATTPHVDSVGSAEEELKLLSGLGPLEPGVPLVVDERLVSGQSADLAEAQTSSDEHSTARLQGFTTVEDVPLKSNPGISLLESQPITSDVFHHQHARSPTLVRPIQPSLADLPATNIWSLFATTPPPKISPSAPTTRGRKSRFFPTNLDAPTAPFQPPNNKDTEDTAFPRLAVSQSPIKHRRKISIPSPILVKSTPLLSPVIVRRSSEKTGILEGGEMDEWEGKEEAFWIG